MLAMVKTMKPFRRGFTLIELLIVIAIIGLLMSIVGVAVMNSLSGARVAATKALMTKVQRQLQSRIEAVNRTYRSQQSSNVLFAEIGSIEKAASQAPGQRFNTVKTALMHKAYLRAYLPQTWDEATFLLKKAGKTKPSPVNSQTESAEVLFFFLSDASIIGFTPANQDLFAGSEVRDTDGNGAMEIVDAWGTPVRFYRWPTRLLRPAGYTGSPTMIAATDVISKANFDRAQLLIQGIPTSLKVPPSATNPGSFAQDPDDPLNVLVPGNGWSTTAADLTTFESGSTAPFPFHTPFTWHTPLVVSPGSDREFGIYDTSDPAHLGRLCEPYTSGASEAYLYDNITNLNVKSGGN
ncbi:MAG: type secretion system protein [Planctomycetaceae bacterium]|nr:type secretion system protein [Planctomycetaceae bacterium]